LAKAQKTGRFVCRDTLGLNAKQLFHAIRELGSHVSVPTLEVHVQSFYDYCNITVGRFMVEIN
jgi:hypothetical protein